MAAWRFRSRRALAHDLTEALEQDASHRLELAALQVGQPVEILAQLPRPFQLRHLWSQSLGAVRAQSASAKPCDGLVIIALAW